MLEFLVTIKVEVFIMFDFSFWTNKPVGFSIPQEGVYTAKFKSWYKKQARKRGAEISFSDGVITKVAHHEV